MPADEEPRGPVPARGPHRARTDGAAATRRADPQANAEGAFQLASYEVNRVLWDFKEAADKRAILGDKPAFLSAHRLSEAERQAFLRPDFAALLDLGALPNLVFKYYMAHGLAPDRYAERIRDDRSSRATG